MPFGFRAQACDFFRRQMFGDTIERGMHVERGLAPDFNTQRLEVGGGLQQLGVDGGTLGLGEIEIGGDAGLDSADDEIHRRMITTGMSNGALDDAAQHEQAAADAAASAKGEHEREQQHGFPARTRSLRSIGVHGFNLDAGDDWTLKLPDEREFVHHIEAGAAGDEGDYSQRSEPGPQPACLEKTEKIIHQTGRGGFGDARRLRGDLGADGSTKINVRRHIGLTSAGGELLPALAWIM